MTRNYQVDSILRSKFNRFIVRTYCLKTVINTIFSATCLQTSIGKPLKTPSTFTLQGSESSTAPTVRTGCFSTNSGTSGVLLAKLQQKDVAITRNAQSLILISRAIVRSSKNKYMDMVSKNSLEKHARLLGYNRNNY